MSTSSLPSLPTDIFENILSQLPVVRGDDSSINSLYSCCLANSRLYEAARISSLWQPHYRTRYTISWDVKERARRNKHGDNWRMMLSERRRLDSHALLLLEEIIKSRSDRISRARRLCQSLSEDVWDVLDLERNRDLPGLYTEDGDPNDTGAVPHVLTRQYWAHHMLGTIARHRAMILWTNIHTDTQENPAPFDQVFAGLSGFFGQPSSMILTELDRLSVECRDYLIASGRSLSVGDLDYDGLAQLCTDICAFMRAEGFGPAQQSFHDLHNHFPHCFLTTHKRTIPLSLVYIFVIIARKIGVMASPTNFPGKVLVHVSSPNPDVSDLYVDVYGSSTKAIVSLRDDIPRLLSRAGITPGTMVQYISPCKSAPMLLRAAQNIRVSLRRAVSEVMSSSDGQAAAYASNIILVILMDGVSLNSFVDHISAFPLDLGPVLMDGLGPLVEPANREPVYNRCGVALTAEEDAAKEKKLRSETSVQHFIGTVFQHAQHKYFGCIVSWEPTCMATEQWITTMGVDSLTRGRHQPFYHVLSLTGPPERYVAEENIIPCQIRQGLVHTFLTVTPQCRRYFGGVTVNDKGWGRMLLSPEIQQAFPEDDAAGEAWLKAQGVAE